jgi:hypothetical protein
VSVNQDDGKLRFHVGGAGITPETFDVGLILSLASEYFDALQKTAQLEQSEFKLSGLSIEPGSVQFATTPSNQRLASRAARSVDAFLVGKEAPPAAIRGHISRLQRELRTLGPEHSAVVSLNKYRRSLLPKDTPEQPLRASRTSMRARVVAMYGNNTARFEAAGEKSGFTLRLSGVDVARRLGSHFMGFVQITAKLLRDSDGLIESGELLGFQPLQPGSAQKAWGSWMQENAPEWNDIPDVESELKREVRQETTPPPRPL